MKLKLTEKQFEEILLNNSKTNPMDITNYIKRSIIKVRLNQKSHLDFWITFICKDCKKQIVKNLGRYKKCTIKYLTFCGRCSAERTNLDKYGVKNVFSSDDFKDKISNTMKEKYGVENPMQSEDIRNKSKETCIRKYGVENPFQYTEFKEKAKLKNLEKLGTEYPMQNEDIRNKAMDTKLESYGTIAITYNYFYDNIYFDSSWELIFYIYHTDKKHKIIREPKYFNYIVDNMIHRYYPDFRVGNKYYEIKGEQFIIRYKNGKVKNLCDFNGNVIEKQIQKYKCIKRNNIVLLTYKEMNKYIIYVEKTYGKNYTDNFKKEFFKNN